jgi:hypothetical protein
MQMWAAGDVLTCTLASSGFSGTYYQDIRSGVYSLPMIVGTIKFRKKFLA